MIYKNHKKIRREERGFFWSLWNVSNNLGGALAPLMVGLGAAAGWRGSLLLAGEIFQSLRDGLPQWIDYGLSIFIRNGVQ